jgi:hypothetical protein
LRAGEYIREVGPAQGGRLRAVEDEKIAAVRRRLGQAVQALDANLVLNRAAEAVYFWMVPAREEHPRRGRRAPEVGQTSHSLKNKWAASAGTEGGRRSSVSQVETEGRDLFLFIRYAFGAFT